MADGNARNRLAPVPFRARLCTGEPARRRGGSGHSRGDLAGCLEPPRRQLRSSAMSSMAITARAAGGWIAEGDLLSRVGISALHRRRLVARRNCRVSSSASPWAFYFRARRAFAIVSALFAIPKIALLPLMILWFGISEPSKDRDDRARRLLFRLQFRRRAASIPVPLKSHPHGAEFSACRSSPTSCEGGADAFSIPRRFSHSRRRSPCCVVVSAEMVGAEKEHQQPLSAGYGNLMRDRSTVGGRRRSVADGLCRRPRHRRAGKKITASWR